VTDHGYQVPLSTRLDLQDAEPILLVVERHALDQPRENLAMGRGRGGRKAHLSCLGLAAEPRHIPIDRAAMENHKSIVEIPVPAIAIR
jgi:hypothetical protein